MGFGANVRVRSSSMNSCQRAGPPPCSSSSSRAFSAELVGRWRSFELPSCANTGRSWIAGSARLRIYFRIDLDIDGFSSDVLEIFDHNGYPDPGCDTWTPVNQQGMHVANTATAASSGSAI